MKKDIQNGRNTSRNTEMKNKTRKPTTIIHKEITKEIANERTDEIKQSRPKQTNNDRNKYITNEITN